MERARELTGEEGTPQPGQKKVNNMQERDIKRISPYNPSPQGTVGR
jgi:hypothetical protein